MRTIRLLCLLFFVIVAAPLPAALSPVPVVEIVSVHLPKVEIRISNPDKTSPCIIWKPGMSWEEQNKWFSLRQSGGGKVWELHPKQRTYTVNYPRPQIIPPGGSVDCPYDFSDDSWELPKGFVAGDWKYEIQAHLEIPRDVDAHQHGVFIGHVNTGWHDRGGNVVEKTGKSVRDEKHAAIETRKDFPLERFKAKLEMMNTGTLPDKQSLGDFFGADFPWENLLGVSEWGKDVSVILPDQRILRFDFRNELPGAFKTTTIEGKPHKVITRVWLPAKEILAETRASEISSIVLTKGAERGLLFKRAFDSEGRIDQKETEDLWR